MCWQGLARLHHFRGKKRMSLLRRWFDPIRSSWFYQKPTRQAVLPTEQGLSVYLRLDDVYSYLAAQQLPATRRNSQ